ncbi:MAG: acyltransferase family protein [Acidimicrobiales bacterium]
MPALDGIRALSILGIMANHGGFEWAAGGIISVNVFFVLSGFLITMLLMKEWTRSGTIRLRAFWARRARRLLPALFVLLGGMALYALFLAPGGTQGSLRADGLSTLFYVANWHDIISGQSYFAQVSAPSPLLQTWTLSIEEQFYLVWPLIVLGLLKWRRSPRLLLVVTVAGAVASAAEMAILFHPHMDPSRLYFGTDTRAQDILVGAVVALVMRERKPASTRAGRIGWSWIAIMAVGIFAWEWSMIGPTPSLPYLGGFLLADATVGLVIIGVTQAPCGLLARALSVTPLTFVGRISYGLYLWHWPIFLALDHARTGLDSWSLFALRCAASFAAAIVSWFVVETPVRRMTFGSWRSWTWVPAGAVATVAVLLVSTASSSAAAETIPFGPKAAQARSAAFHITSFPKKGRLLRVLFVGDSLGLTVAYWTAPYAAQYGIALGGRTMSGCGVATAVPYNMHGNVTYPLAPCAKWPSLWRSDIKQLHPQVVALVIGWWETMDRMYRGRWQHLGDPQFNAYETSRLEEAVSVLSSGGAKVALMTAPYFDSGEQPNGRPWNEDNPARVNILNGIIKSVAARHPGVVSVIPLNKFLDPHGHFTWKINGQVMRMGDGVHTTKAAGTYLAPKILPLLAAMGRR